MDIGNLPLDAFYRVRTSTPETMFDSQMQYDLQPYLWYTKKTSNGTETHLPNESSCSLGVNNGNGEYCIRQTKQYFRYQPGKSLLVICTGIFGQTVANCSKRMGYFDANNGVFLENNGGTLRLCKRSYVSGSVVNTYVDMKDWNNMKNINGLVIDPTKGIIFWADIEWLGLGTIRCGIFIDGRPILLHSFHHAGIVSTAYSTTMNLPIRYEIINTSATSATSTFRQVCTTVITEGGYQEVQSFPCAATNGATTINVTTRRPIISIRPSATFNSIANRSQIRVASIDVRATGNDALIELVYNPTALTNSSFSAVDATYSAVEKDVAATAITGGTTIGAFNVLTAGGGSNTKGSAQQGVLSRLPLTLDIDGSNPIPFTVVATSLSGTAVLSATINWQEFR